MRRKQSLTIAPLLANTAIRYLTNLSKNDVGTKTLIFAGVGGGGGGLTEKTF